jgi:hypothetical protein
MVSERPWVMPERTCMSAGVSVSVAGVNEDGAGASVGDAGRNVRGAGVSVNRSGVGFCNAGRVLSGCLRYGFCR